MNTRGGSRIVKHNNASRKPGGTRWECLSRVSTPISRFIGRTICAVLFNFRFPIAVAPWLDLPPMFVRRPRLLNFWLRENSARDNASRNWVQSSPRLDPGSSVLKGERHDPDVSVSFRWKVSVNGRIYARSTLYPLLDELFGEGERERERGFVDFIVDGSFQLLKGQIRDITIERLQSW